MQVAYNSLGEVREGDDAVFAEVKGDLMGPLEAAVYEKDVIGMLYRLGHLGYDHTIDYLVENERNIQANLPHDYVNDTVY